MPERRTVVRIGSYGVHVESFERLLAWHGPETLRLPAERPSAIGWTLRQAALRALAAPPRLGGHWADIDVRGPDGGPYTLTFRGEVAAFAEPLLRGDISLSVTTGSGHVTAFAVLTREVTEVIEDDTKEIRR